jgi:hypothetical protein
MGLFRRRREQTLNEQLLQEAGLDRPPDPPAPVDPLAGTYPAEANSMIWGHTANTVPRPAENDVYVTAHAPQIAGDEVEFAALPDGDLIVDEEQGDADLSPLADAIERQLGPPYRATGRREEGDLWAVAARRIDVCRFACDAGDAIQLVCRGGRRELEVDRVPSELRIPELEQAGEERGEEYVVQASRLDGNFWEVQASAL